MDDSDHYTEAVGRAVDMLAAMSGWFEPVLDALGGPGVEDRQMITWLPHQWGEVATYADPCRAAITALASDCPEGVRRQDVAAVGAEHGPVALFVAAMVFGLGDRPSGPRSVLDMLSESHVADDSGEPIEPLRVIEGIMTGSSHVSADIAFRSLFKDGDTRVHGLNVSLGTKAIYFSALEAMPKHRALILDDFVFNGVQQVLQSGLAEPNAIALDPRKHTWSADYLQYCTWAEDVAEVERTVPEDVEVALFKLGKGEVSPPIAEL